MDIKPKHVQSPPGTKESGKTSRGFVAPNGLIEQIGHREDHFFVVRLTKHEARQVLVGRENPKSMRLLSREDGTYDGVCPE